MLVPTFNNPTYLHQMIAQLHQVGLDKIVVLDNGSAFPPHRRLLEALERDGVMVVRMGLNFGPRFAMLEPEILAALPQIFLYSDPDIAFGPDLPARFWETLEQVSGEKQIGKVGLALAIDERDRLRQETFDIGGTDYHIWDWEAQFWTRRVELANDVVGYDAQIDTTFFLCNKKYYSPADFMRSISLAGPFTAKHLPWYQDTVIPADEIDFYRARQTASFYSLGPRPAAHE